MRRLVIALIIMIFMLSGCGEDSSGGYIVDAQPELNHAPIANDISTSSDLTSPYIQVSLIATDPDNDTISYHLMSPYLGSSGSGYEYAFIEPSTNILHVSLKSDYSDNRVVLNYKASDSIEFSNNATVTISIVSSENHGLGYEDEDMAVYSQIPTHYFDESILTTQSNELPSSVDLSANMPIAGDQGLQNSCVGWAIGYALKSYQEKLEMGWVLNSPSTIFSPSYIYNQINGGEDLGSIPSEAFELVVDSGAATWKMMPYSSNDYLTQPSYLIKEHASSFKAKEYKKLTDTNQMKASLINKHPVMVAIQLNNSFNYLKGSDSVYTTLGNYNGGHAVVVTGYDDNRYGGSFKILNSYGIGWGDSGYFYLPYKNVSELLLGAYVLIDKPNDTNTVKETQQPIRENLPNLEVKEWKYRFNSLPGGDGALYYTVINSGTATANAGFDVSLMLSKDREFTASDIYVTYEEIPFELDVGDTAYRDENDEMLFNLPRTLEAGVYYMALWVDDMDEVYELNENDNISIADDTVTIQSALLPDITIDSWYTSWGNDGSGELSYRVCNTGGSSTLRTDWDITLVLSTTINPSDDPDHHFIFYEDVGFILDSFECVYRDIYTLARYSLFEDAISLQPIPRGEYYISLWVDDQNLEAESNENNNYSTGDNSVRIRSNRTRSIDERKSAFNGRNIIKEEDVKKVLVTVDNKGRRSIKTIKDDDVDKEPKIYYEKVISSSKEVVFPVMKRYSISDNN